MTSTDGPPRTLLHVVNLTRGTTLATDLRPARSPWARARGLLGQAALAPGAGLRIEPCRAVHTCGMRFPIDLVYLDRTHRVLKTVTDLHPYRCSWGGRRAHAVLELPAGTIAATGTRVSDHLALIYAGMQDSRDGTTMPLPSNQSG